MSGDGEYPAPGDPRLAVLEEIELAAACAEVDRLDHVGRTLLLAYLLGGYPQAPGLILDAVTEMRAGGQLPGPALTLHQGGRQ